MRGAQQYALKVITVLNVIKKYCIMVKHVLPYYLMKFKMKLFILDLLENRKNKEYLINLSLFYEVYMNVKLFSLYIFSC